jgi:ABC-type uncharacterized transport system substrate-binding protein
LLSYGVGVDLFRRAATYVDRVLRGEKPGDLPVQFSTKFEMAVNLKTAKASDGRLTDGSIAAHEVRRRTGPRVLCFPPRFDPCER